MKIKITNISSICTWSSLQNQLIILQDTDILIENSKIAKISKNIIDADEEIDADGALITPGFVDSHTHPIFSGNRSQEFSMRLSGKSYEEISELGGGIISSINDLRSVDEEQLFEECIERVNFFLNHGTTTIEAKSGYGLTLKDELKSLRVIKRLNQESDLDIVPTFLGAHDFPPEYKNNKSDYVALICEEMIPEVAEKKLAEFCDVFCEEGYYSIEDSERILESAKNHGLTPRLHADEFIDSKAASLAAKVGAISADHLMEVSDDGIRAMAKKNVIATLLPGTTLFLGKNKYAPGRKLIDYGCEVALATDYNPGSCTIQSMPQIISLGTLYCGLTSAEAFKASTFNGARAINRECLVGLVAEGYQADLLFWDLSNIDEIPYWMGSDRILNIMKNGKLLDG